METSLDQLAKEVQASKLAGAREEKENRKHSTSTLDDGDDDEEMVEKDGNCWVSLFHPHISLSSLYFFVL
jgi:hypothetical protein